MKRKDENNKTLDWIIKIILIIIIIFLLIHNCSLMKKNREYENSGGNIDIIEIGCDDNRCKPIPKEIESIAFDDNKVSIKKGDSLKLIVSINPVELSSSKLTWKSSDESIVTVDENGIITGIKNGKAVITVTSSNEKTATCTVEVVNDSVNVKKINLSVSKNTITVGSVIQVKAKVEPSNATNRELVWTSSDPSIATVDANGIVKGIKNGTVTITAKTKDGKVVASTKITVKVPEPVIENIKFSQDNVSIKKDDTLGLTVIVTPSELSSSKLTWKTSDESVVTVDESGKIKGINVGSATITVTSANGKTATCKVNVVEESIEVQEIVLTPLEKTIGNNRTTQVIADIKPENATNRELVWTSSDSSVATVDANGVVKGIKNGIVTITAKTKDGKVVASTKIIIDENINNEKLSVFDDDHTPVTWDGANDLKIFEKTLYTVDGKIAPESSNTYQFVVRNNTKYNIKYDIDFIETNPYNINMKYKLKKNDTYLIDHYVSASEINVIDVPLNSSNNDTYYLEWKWISSDNDTQIGKAGNASYGLKIEIKAESTNG